MSTINFALIVKQMLSVSPNVTHLLFSPGSPAQVRFHSLLTPVHLPELTALTAQHTRGIAELLMRNDDRAKALLDQTGAAEFSFLIPNLGRFRVHVFRERDALSLIMRVLPNRVRSLRELGLPDQLRPITQLKDGFVLISGPTGSGKSTTLAALVDAINANRHCHIVSVEDPVEFIHPHKRATLGQRELHKDVASFAEAFRAALRFGAPDVLVADAVTDQPCVEILLEAVQTGRLVLATYHASRGVPRALDEFLSLYAPAASMQTRARLADCLRYVTSQILLPAASGAFTAALEVLALTPRTRECLRTGDTETHNLSRAIREGDKDGMLPFDAHLEALVRSERISMETAFRFAADQQHFMDRIPDLAPSTDPAFDVWSQLDTQTAGELKTRPH